MSNAAACCKTAKLALMRYSAKARCFPYGNYKMRIKWFGTATIIIEQDGTKLLFDPFLTLNEKVFKPPIDELSTIENIMVTHGHLDHIVDIPVILKHGDGKAKIYCTNKPRETLLAKGVDSERIHTVKPGDVLDFPPFKVCVLKGKHIIFDKWRIIKTLLNPRIIIHFKNVRHMLRENRACAESGETVIYDISVYDERILLMGSLNLDDETEYPKGADLLVLPFQGRSDINKYSMQFISRLQPKKVLLDHFDDTFPPISSHVETGRFISDVHRSFPDIPVICPQASAEWINII